MSIYLDLGSDSKVARAFDLTRKMQGIKDEGEWALELIKIGVTQVMTEMNQNLEKFNNEKIILH